MAENNQMCTNSTEKMESPQEALPAWENSIKANFQGKHHVVVVFSQVLQKQIGLLNQ